MNTFTSSNVYYSVERTGDPQRTELFDAVQNQLLTIQKSQEPKDMKALTPKNSVRAVSVEDALKELRDMGIT